MEEVEELLAGRQQLLAGVLLELVGAALLLLPELVADGRLSVGVEAEENGTVAKRVLLLGEGALGLRGASGTDNTLDLIGVDDAGDVGVGNLGQREREALLQGRGLVVGAEELVELLDSVLGPDAEAANVSTGSELEQVQAANVDELNTGDVAEGLDDTLVLVVDDKGAAALGVAAVTDLANTSTELARVRDLDNVVVGLEGLEESNGLLGLGERLSGARDNKGDLLNLLDAVTTGEDKRRHGSGSQSRSSSVTLLVLVGLDEPTAPKLGRGEHATTTDHVTEGSLSLRNMRTRSQYFRSIIFDRLCCPTLSMFIFPALFPRARTDASAQMGHSPTIPMSCLPNSRRPPTKSCSLLATSIHSHQRSQAVPT